MKPTTTPNDEAIRFLDNKYASMIMTAIIPIHSIRLGFMLLRYMTVEFAIIKHEAPINSPPPTPRPKFLADFICQFVVSL